MGEKLYGFCISHFIISGYCFPADSLTLSLSLSTLKQPLKFTMSMIYQQFDPMLHPDPHTAIQLHTVTCNKAELCHLEVLQALRRYTIDKASENSWGVGIVEPAGQVWHVEEARHVGHS